MFSVIRIMTVCLAVIVLSGCDRIKDFPVGLGFSAKYLCSFVFNSGFPEQQVIDDFIAPKVKPLPLIWQIDVDYEQQLVTVGSRLPLLDLPFAQAQYRPNMGCTLILDGSREQLLSEQISATPSAPLANNQPWPFGSAGVIQADKVKSDVNMKLIQQAVDAAFVEAAGPRNTTSLLVAYDGQLIAEQYGSGANAQTPLLGWSMTKTITGMLTGLLVDQKKLSLQSPAPIAEWKNTSKQKITLRNLMNMSSGLEFDEDYTGLSDASKMLYLAPDQAQYASMQSHIHAPAEVFNYSTGETLLLANIVQTALGGSSQQAYDFYQSQLFQPLGIRSGFIEFDISGQFVGGAYGFMKARDWLRLGQLYLQRGQWGDDQVISKDWVDFVVSRSPATHKYGGQVWLNQKGVKSPELPDDAFYFSGHQGQRIVVVPSKKLVVLRTGVTEEKSDIQIERTVSDIIAALPQSN